LPQRKAKPRTDGDLEIVAAAATGRAREAIANANAMATTFLAQLQQQCPELVTQYDDVVAAFRAARTASVAGMMEIYNA